MIPYLITTIVIGLSTIPQTIWILSRILPCRRSIHWITGLAGCKLLLYSFGIDYYLRLNYEGTVWWHLLWLFFGTMIPVAMYLVFFYVFDGQPVKRILTPILSETVIELLAMIGLSLASLLATGSFAADLSADLGIYVLLVPLFGYGLFFLLWKLLKKPLVRYHEYEFRCTKALWVVIILYLFFSLSSYWGDAMASGFLFYKITLLPNLLLLFYLFVLLIRSDAQSEREQLHRAKMDAVRRALSAEYQSSLSEQENLIRKNRSFIEQNLEQMNGSGRAAAEYYEKLKKTYREINAGVYSDHRLLDAVIAREVRRCRSLGTNLVVTVSPLSLDLHTEEVLIETLMLLFDVLQGESPELAITQTAGRVLIRYSCKASKDAAKTAVCRPLQALIDREHGGFSRTVQDGRTVIELFF